MAAPAPLSLIDDKVLRTMRNLIVNAVQVHRLPLAEARGRAWGYAHAYHAWLPAETIEAAVRHCCFEAWPAPQAGGDAELGARAAQAPAASAGRASAAPRSPA